MQEFELSVNGLKVKAAYDSATIDGVLIPLVKRWSNLARGLGRRMIVFMAGAPGTGKSCCAQTLEELSLSVEGTLPLTAVSLDGFHYPNSYLRSNVADVDGREVRLSDIKGAPETFDLNAFRAKLIELKRGKRVLMPAYSRKTHEVEENAIAVDTRIVLIEGNYLLLDERGWRGLCAYCNDSVFIEATPSELEARLVERKVEGGMKKAEAEAFYAKSDRRNVERVLAHRVPCAVTLEQSGINHLSRKTAPSSPEDQLR